LGLSIGKVGRTTCAALALLALGIAARTPADTTRGVVFAGDLPYRVDRTVRIPMRDGIRLAAVVYRPAGDNFRLPVIATMTPYIADGSHGTGVYFARHGYVFAAIDSRGRGDSGGEFNPWVNEGRDLHDALEWLAARPYADGRTATWGGSYLGKNQWAAAGLVPASLRTIVPVSAGLVGFDMGMRRNIPFAFMGRYLTLISGRVGNRNLYQDLDYWNAIFAQLSRGEVSWRNLDALAGNPSSIWQEWNDHPEQDAYWDSATPTDAQFAQIRIPVLTITGLYDDAQLGTLEFRRRWLARAGRDVRPGAYTVIGPWNHGGTRRPRTSLGGLDFGPDSALDVMKLQVEWYDWVLKGAPRPALLTDHFLYFITGSNRWAHAPDLEDATRALDVLYLSSPDTSAGSVSQRGELVHESPAHAVDTYVYDPGVPGFNEGVEAEDAVSENFLTDDRSVSRLHGDGLVYDSREYPKGVEIVGRPCVWLYAAMDVPDTDIRVQLFEVRSDGRSIFLAQDLMRARYRDGPRRATLVTPGHTDVYLFNEFPFVARTLAPKSRVRLVISPVGASIHQQRNRNSGGVVADETAADNRIAHVSVAIGTKLSAVAIPLGR
jgi:uncharacterized protein